MSLWSERCKADRMEILEWCFAHGRRPGDEEISVWNAFLRKRGWRDEASEELAECRRNSRSRRS